MCNNFDGKREITLKVVQGNALYGQTGQLNFAASMLRNLKAA